MESFGVKIGTFQHVLEGYKIADEIAQHGAGGSTFADWWAYKFEVYDAIPYNASLMRERGVVVPSIQIPPIWRGVSTPKPRKGSSSATRPKWKP